MEKEMRNSLKGRLAFILKTVKISSWISEAALSCAEGQERKAINGRKPGYPSWFLMKGKGKTGS